MGTPSDRTKGYSPSPPSVNRQIHVKTLPCSNLWMLAMTSGFVLNRDLLTFWKKCVVERSWCLWPFVKLGARVFPSKDVFCRILRNSIECDKSLKHELGSFLMFYSYLCLHGAVLAYLSLTQQVVGSNTTFYNFFIRKNSTRCHSSF